jgi:hypothetical protein
MVMANDNAFSESREAEAALSFPSLRSVEARRVTYKTPRRFIIKGEEKKIQDVIEIEVETSGEFPIAGTGPALFIGEIVFTDSERVAERRYRFYGPGTVSLREGAPISLGRAGSGIPKPEYYTKLRLKWAK